VEAVFLTNNDEAARLAAGTRQVDIASAIAAGIDAWTLSVTAAGRGN
jgi:N-acetylmuramoyl-L-alanine amidase